MPARMRRWIAERNIRHWRELLEQELDSAQRQTLADLIKTEEAKLNQPLNPQEFPGQTQ
jgi:hypothetical protein